MLESDATIPLAWGTRGPAVDRPHVIGLRSNRITHRCPDFRPFPFDRAPGGSPGIPTP